MIIDKVIRGKNIYLRSLSEDEASERYAGWLADPVVNQFMESRHQVWSVDSLKKYVNENNSASDTYLLGIFNDQDSHIGNIKLGPIHPIHQVAYLSLFIGEKSSWGKGIATDAISLMCRFGFEKCNLYKISAGMYMKNTGSLQAFLKAGFQLEGIFKSHSVVKGTERTDVFLVAMLKDNYLMRED